LVFVLVFFLVLFLVLLESNVNPSRFDFDWLMR